MLWYSILYHTILYYVIFCCVLSYDGILGHVLSTYLIVCHIHAIILCYMVCIRISASGLRTQATRSQDPLQEDCPGQSRAMWVVF